MKANWGLKTLGEVSKISYGYTDSASFDNVGPKFLRITDIQENYVNWSQVPVCSCSEADLPKYKLADGDIVFARTGATTGKSYLIRHPPNAVFASYLIRVKIISQKELMPAFLALFFQTKSYWDSINKGLTGSAQGGFNATKLSELSIPIPPLSEQQRIVSVLDEAFAAIARAKATAEQNLKNARELFESYLQKVFDTNGEKWDKKKLCEVCELKPPKKEARNKLKETDLVTFLPMEDLGVLNKEIAGIKERKLKDVEGAYTYFANNDVLLAKITPCFENGKIGIAKNLKNGVGFGSSEYLVFRSHGNVDPEYLYYFLSRNQMREEGRKFMSGAVGHKRVSKDWIENYVIPFPKSVNEQTTIVQRLNSLAAETKKLEAVYQEKIRNLEELKASILQRAFTGEFKTLEQVPA